MKISGPLKLFRSLIRYLGCKKAFSKFKIRIFEFLTLDFGPRSSIAPKQKKNETPMKLYSKMANLRAVKMAKNRIFFLNAFEPIHCFLYFPVELYYSIFGTY